MNWPLLIAAMIQVESHGDSNAVGDNGKSHGCLQIQAGVLTDVNNYYNTEYTQGDCLVPAKAKAICRMYLVMYGKKYKEPTKEVYARIWNGGYAGYFKDPHKTDYYWSKVFIALHNIKQ
jgi:hypothetical protein